MGLVIIACLAVGVLGIWGAVSFLYRIRSDVRSLHYILNIASRKSSGVRREVGLFSENYLNLDEIPSALIYGILLLEDEAFFAHQGWSRDYKTIQQLLINELFLAWKPQFLQKILEIPYSMILNREFSKKEILALYVSGIEWGAKIHGLQLASQNYFKKPVSELNFEESVYLASIATQPEAFEQDFKNHSPLSLEHANRMARTMSQLLLLNPMFEKIETKGIDPLLSSEKLYDVLRVIDRAAGANERKRRADLQASLLLTRFSALYLKPILFRPHRRKSTEVAPLLN